MEDISDYIHGTKQQIQTAYDWLEELDSQSRDWAFTLDDIPETKKADRFTRIAVLREAAMHVQRMFEALQNAAVL